MKRLYKDSLLEVLVIFIKFLLNGLTKLFHLNKNDLIYIILSIIPLLTITRIKDIPIHTKSFIYIIASLMLLMASIFFKLEKDQFLKAMKKSGLIEREMPKYYHTRHKKDIKVVRIGNEVPITKVISRLTFLSKMLKYNILDVHIRPKYLIGYKCQEIILSKYDTTPYKLLLLEKLYLALYRLIDDIKNLDHNEDMTKFLITFNSEKTFKFVKGLENELTHRCKKNEGELTINPHLKKDYLIIIKKDLSFEMDFRKLYESNKSDLAKKIIPWIAGYNENSGTLQIFDLKDFIHLIIAGASGNGKSNILHTILLSILLTDKDIEFYIMDPKINEFKAYRSLKNIKYFNDFDSISRAIKDNVIEMKRRNKLIERDDYIRDIDGYNNKYTVRKMKYRLIVIDEIADIMLNPDKKLVDEFSNNINKLAQTSRNVGFRLILSTQNPTKDVLKKFIKANIQSRVAMGTSNKTDSRTILDNNMASEIESPGKFVLQFKKKNAFYYSPFIPDKSLVEILNYIKQRPHPNLEDKKETPALIKDKGTLRGKILNLENLEINNSQNLYNFYINLQLIDGILPVKQEIKNHTNLSDHQLRKLNDELKQQGLLKLIDNKKLKVIDIDNELEVKRLQIRGGAKS